MSVFSHLRLTPCDMTPLFRARRRLCARGRLPALEVRGKACGRRGAGRPSDSGRVHSIYALSPTQQARHSPSLTAPLAFLSAGARAAAAAQEPGASTKTSYKAVLQPQLIKSAEQVHRIAGVQHRPVLAGRAFLNDSVTAFTDKSLI